MIKGNNHARPRFCVVLLDVFDTAGIGYIAPSLITERGLEQPAPAPVLSAAFGLAARRPVVGTVGRSFRACPKQCPIRKIHSLSS
jgi:hypothetical protein